MGKEAFKKYCETRPDLPLFLQYDWISGIAREDQWDVALSHAGSEITGFLVYFIKRKYGFSRITLPPLTPFLGPWIEHPPDQKTTTRLGHEKKVMEDLIEGLPPYDDLTLNFHPGFTHWLPFYWHGFGQSTQYTYFLGPQDPEGVFSGLKDNIKRQIRKARKTIHCEESDDIGLLHRLKQKDYAYKGRKLPYSFEHFQRIDTLCRHKECRKLLFAVDDQGFYHAGVYLVWDSGTTYYLVGASDPEYRNSGAMSLLMWEAVRASMEAGRSFNFEGSMIESIERFFRSFGATPTPYHQVRRTPSFLLRGMQAFRHLFKSQRP